jgi:hypothetical protein
VAEQHLVDEVEVKTDRSSQSQILHEKMGNRRIWQIVGNYGLLLVLSTIWGIGFAAIRSAVSELSSAR